MRACAKERKPSSRSRTHKHILHIITVRSMEFCRMRKKVNALPGANMHRIRDVRIYTAGADDKRMANILQQRHTMQIATFPDVRTQRTNAKIQ